MMQQRSKKSLGSSSQTHRHAKRQTSDPVPCRFCTGAPQPLYQVKNKLWNASESTRSNLTKLMNLTLPLRYSQSQTYYYTKPINEYLHSQRNTQVIKLKEMISFSGVEGDEWMRRFYSRVEIPNKIHLLTEYYRFHNEIPRMFMIPESDIMNNYHDKKRRIEYFRIAKEIEDENRKNPDKPPKGIVGDKPDVKRESEDQTVLSGEEQKYYGNLLEDITLEKNISLTVQEINQKLDEAMPNRKLIELTKQFEKDLSNLNANEEENLKRFLSSIKEQEPKPSFTKKIKRELNLDEGLLSQAPSPGQQKSPTIRKTPSSALQVNVKSPQSARNNPQFTNINAQSKTTANKAVINKSNQPFFLSEALQARLLAQQQLINLHIQKQQFSISPRSLSNKNVVSPQKPAPPKSGYAPKTSMAQGFQGSQEAYQIPGFDIQPIMSAKNSVKQFFPSPQQKKSNALVTAESSPSHKQKPPTVIGSQTHRVTSHKDIQNLLKMNAASKETLNRILQPNQPSKQLADFFLMQIQALKQNQSNSSNKLKVASPTNQAQLVQQMGRRNSKNAKLRKSLNNAADNKHSVPTHQGHTKSEIHQEPHKFSTTESTRRVSKV